MTMHKTERKNCVGYGSSCNYWSRSVCKDVNRRHMLGTLFKYDYCTDHENELFSNAACFGINDTIINFVI